MQAYDSHCNLVLGEVEETVYVVEEDEDEEETIKTISKKSEMLFVRGMLFLFYFCYFMDYGGSLLGGFTFC